MPTNGASKQAPMPYAVGGFSPLPARAKMQISVREFEVFRGLALRLDKTAEALTPKEAASAEPTDTVRKSKRRKKRTQLLSIGTKNIVLLSIVGYHILQSTTTFSWQKSKRTKKQTPLLSIGTKKCRIFIYRWSSHSAIHRYVFMEAARSFPWPLFS